MVSPLVALMRDQLSHLPPQLPAAMLWSEQTWEHAKRTLDDLRVRSYIASEFLRRVRQSRNLD